MLPAETNHHINNVERSQVCTHADKQQGVIVAGLQLNLMALSKAFNLSNVNTSLFIKGFLK